jgi:hypothetical protein
MAWYDMEESPAAIEAAKKRKAEAEVNEAYKHAKEKQASGYHCITEMLRH